MSLLNSIKEHEAFRAKPYIDPLAKKKIPKKDLEVIEKYWGKLKVTFGYGFTFLTEPEGGVVLRNKIAHIRIELEDKLPVFHRLSKKRQEVLIEMAYQLGVAGLLKFKKMIQALIGRNYDRAHREMLDSVWARKTPNRANELAKKMLKG